MRARMTLMVIGALVALVGCGSAAESGGSRAPSEASVGGATAFPVVIRHAFGESTIESEPQRVVALGYNDIAVANALGAPIVGAIPGYDPDDPNLPYIDEPLAPEVLGLPSDTLDIERVAAYTPDLILATSSFLIDQQSYDQLSGIAPVVVYEEALYTATAGEEALLIGRALGREAQAQELVDASEAAIAAFVEDLPGLRDSTYLFGQGRGEVIPLVIGEDNQSTAFMRSLGLRVPTEFADREATAELAPGTIGLSYEEAALLDTADALFMTFPSAQEQQRFESNPLIARLAVVEEDRYQLISLDAATFLQAPNVAGTEWMLEQLSPTLRRIGG